MSPASPDRSRTQAADRSELQAWLDASRAWFERELAVHFAPAQGGVPGSLGDAMLYAVSGGGKRVRPMLVRLACHWCGGDDAACVRPAVAVELIHAYSLVHDDLPCMDDDDWRRGRPSCHKQFGEALALLAADALQSKAFEVLARAIGGAGMVGGQVLDMTLTDEAPQAIEIERMHALKTGALITAAAELGAIAADAKARERELVRAYAAAIGACFQA